MSTCTVAADGQHVASGSWDKTLKLWDLLNGHEISHFRYADVFTWRDGRWQVVYTQVTMLP